MVPWGGRLVLSGWLDGPDGPGAGHLARERGAIVEEREEARSVWLDLSGGYDAYLATRGPAVRKTARKD